MAVLIPAWKCLAVTGVLLGIGGCTNSVPESEVTGTVTVNEQPVLEGQITFHPVSGGGKSASGRIEYGNYRLKVPPGEKLVEIYGQREIPGRYSSELVNGQKVLMREEFVPSRYNTKSELKATIPAASSTQDFHLKPE